MRKTIIGKIFCIMIMAVMLFSSMGIGAFAAVDNGVGAPQQTEEKALSSDDETQAGGENVFQAAGEEGVVYTVTFEQRGYGSETPAQSVAEGGYAVKPEDPKSSSRIFGGWFTDSECTEGNEFDFENTTVTEDITLYAKWTIKTFNVKFYAKGHGTAPKAQTVEYGGYATKPANLKADGYTFYGWVKKGYATPFDFESTPVKGNLYLYAKWVPKKLDPVAGVYTLPGHQRIKLVWKRLYVDGYSADRYLIKRARNDGSYQDFCYVYKDGTIKKINAGKMSTKALRGNGQYSIEDKDVGDGLISYDGTYGRNGGDFRYKVIAQKWFTTKDAKTGKYVSSYVTEAKVAKNSCVKTSYVKLQLTTGKTLTSHDRKKVTKSFAKGSTIYTCSFGIGQYMFIKDNHMFWLNRIGTKNQESGFTRTAYSDKVAEYFVNNRPDNGSKTNKLIWVSTYTQHLYIFKKSDGKWKLMNSGGWKISTGRASSPTIRTIDPKDSNLDSGRKIGKIKSICNKLRTRHGIPYWNCFSSFNAIHGKKAKWSIQSIPKSGGCVRNTNDHAQWVYNNCAKGTGVILF